MAGPRVHDAQCVAQGVQVHRHRPHHRGGRVGEVDGHRAAHGGGGLVHEAALLAEIEVLRLLAHLGDLHRRQLIPAEQVIFNDTQQHLAGRRGGQAGAGQHVGEGVGVKARHRVAPPGGLGRHPPHQGGGGLLLLLLGVQGVQLHLHQGPALRLEADGVGAVGGGAGRKIQVHRRGQHPSVLVVGVVAADLRAARCGTQRHRGVLPPAEGPLEAVQQLSDPLPAGRGVPAHQAGQSLVQLAGRQRSAYFAQIMHGHPNSFFSPGGRSVASGRPGLLSFNHSTARLLFQAFCGAF